jgi:hypothetical protein
VLVYDSVRLDGFGFARTTVPQYGDPLVIVAHVDEFTGVLCLWELNGDVVPNVLVEIFPEGLRNGRVVPLHVLIYEIWSEWKSVVKFLFCLGPENSEFCG